MKHTLRFLLAFIFLSVTLLSQRAEAAQTDVKIRLRPHCEEGSQTPCREFPLYDSERAITAGLTAGSFLDLDIVVTNPGRQRLQSIQSWLEYDSAVLRGREIRIADTFPLVAPGEQAFDASALRQSSGQAPLGTSSGGDGLVKLGASNVSGGAREEEILFARVTFEVIARGEDLSHAVKFHEFSLLGQEGKTKVLLVEDGKTVNVLRTRPLDLLLYFGEGAPPTTVPQPGTLPLPGTTIPPGNQPPAHQPPIVIPLPGGTVPPIVTDPDFARLQVQGLQVTTDSGNAGNNVYLRWQELLDPRVSGYNLYYGTVSGQYIQRRTVSAQTTGITVRGLPAGKRYFFAVTAFNTSEQESDFSYEVAVVVSDPGSSTAPFTIVATPDEAGGRDGGTLPGSVTPGKGVPGQTGMPLLLIPILLILASLSAVFFRRKKSA
ncbi:MAG: fibronectin type III domain-containing protein [Patescibacteria group bacterium]